MTAPKETSFFPFLSAQDALYSGRAFYPVEARGQMWQTVYPYAPTRFCIEIYDWIRKNPAPEGEFALHDIDGGDITYRLPGTTNDTVNQKNRFYFTHLEHATAFRAWIKTLEVFHGTQLFASMRPVRGTAHALAGVIGYPIVADFSNHNIALFCWCRDNLVGQMFSDGQNVFFEKDEDLILFRLTIIGDDEKKPNAALVPQPLANTWNTP